MRRFVHALLVLSFLSIFQLASAQEYGRTAVFQYVSQAANGSVADVAAQIEGQAIEAGFEVLARVPSESPSECGFSSQVLLLRHPAHTASVFAANPKTAAYGALDRIVVFEDEAGVHSAVVNPAGILRTVLMDDTGVQALAFSRLEALRAVATVSGTTSTQEYGPSRDRGLIGKTMGVMAGGPFGDKIQVHGTVPGTNWRQVAEAVFEAFAQPEPEWGLASDFVTFFDDQEVAIVGVSGSKMESRSFGIVGVGSDKSRKGFECPGIAHGAAYPLEVVVVRNGNTVEIQFVDAMYRMKMYFEDAGKWAFMKNMTMPGSIADALKARINDALAAL